MPGWLIFEWWIIDEVITDVVVVNTVERGLDQAEAGSAGAAEAGRWMETKGRGTQEEGKGLWIVVTAH